MNIEDNGKKLFPVRKIEALVKLEPTEDEEVQKEGRHLPKELQDSFTGAQKKMYKGHLCNKSTIHLLI